MAGADGEFAEFETDEATFEAMMTEAEPAELVAGPEQRTVRFEYASGLPIIAPSSSVRARSSRSSLIVPPPRPPSGVASIGTPDEVAS